MKETTKKYFDALKNAGIIAKTFAELQHERLMTGSEEYRSGYNWAIDIAARKNLSSAELISAAYRYADIKCLAMKGIMYGFRQLASRRVAA